MELVGRDLHKSYGSQQVVRGVDLRLVPGQVLGLLGPNGAGKSTTVGMLYGMVKPSRGMVRMGPYDVTFQGVLARRYMGVVTQDDNLDPDLDVTGNLIAFARYYGLVGLAARYRIGELLEALELDQFAHHRIEELSGGTKRRLVLARALLNKPAVVFLDEPTTGLDPDVRQQFWRLVLGLKSQGCGVLLTTHYMDEAERLCDHLLLMQAGQVVDQGSPQELIERTVGREVLEVEGVEGAYVQEVAMAVGSWVRPFSSGFLLALPETARELLISKMEHARPSRMVHRKANLEDVFLHVTGSRLE
ncbi:MAG: ABC transporter ATP-binding protein [Thermostichales cyanobacterium SZTDM-1c_bins_54]